MLLLGVFITFICTRRFTLHFRGFFEHRIKRVSDSVSGDLKSRFSGIFITFTCARRFTLHFRGFFKHRIEGVSESVSGDLKSRFSGIFFAIVGSFYYLYLYLNIYSAFSGIFLKHRIKGVSDSIPGDLKYRFSVILVTKKWKRLRNEFLGQGIFITDFR